MFKRVIKIILICLAIFLIILGIIWLIGRHTATKNSGTPLSFKEFLGLGTKNVPATTIAPGQNTSAFTGNTSGINGNGNGNGINGFGAGINNSTPNISKFTNSGISPVGNNGIHGIGSGINGTGNNNGLSANGISGAGINANTNNDNGEAGAAVCSTEDTTITFTPEEVAQLNQLQNQFYAIAQNLHTDADVATELANHDAFEIKAEQDVDLYNYCEAQLPNVEQINPSLNKHIPTPFWDAWTTGNLWNNSGRTDHDDLTFLVFDPNTAGHLQDIHDHNSDNPDTSGITGPYGLLSFSDPTAVNISGSSVKTNTSCSTSYSDPLGSLLGSQKTGCAPARPGTTVTTTTNGPDFDLFLPVIERILRINLW